MRNSATGTLVLFMVIIGLAMSWIDGSANLWLVFAPAILTGLFVAKSIR